jgi:subtilisin family serine protease
MTGPRAWSLAAAALGAWLALVSVVSAQGPDPFLSRQWHLLDRETEPAGANVLAAWPTTRGLGVVIGIVDDGLQTTHPDLQPNLSAPLSFDFVENDADPNPRLVGSCNPALLSDVLGEGCHGTAVGGLAAARGDNGLGVSGVAPRATLAGLRLLGRLGAATLPSPVGDAEEALAIGFRTDAIHVKNFSFGPADDGATLERPGALAEAALQAAATQGRGGRGSVLVWAAGNGGLADNCNFDGYASSRFVIAAGPLGDDAQPAPYAEPCSALFVVTPSSGGFRNITTTDITGLPGYDPGGGAFTDRFGGTSASAPIVSGVAALLVAANPSACPGSSAGRRACSRTARRWASA